MIIAKYKDIVVIFSSIDVKSGCEMHLNKSISTTIVLMKRARKRYSIYHNRSKCTGNPTCATVDPAHFNVSDEGKANLIGGKEVSSGLFLLETDELGLAVEAAHSCFGKSIKILDNKTGKSLTNKPLTPGKIRVTF